MKPCLAFAFLLACPLAVFAVEADSPSAHENDPQQGAFQRAGQKADELIAKGKEKFKAASEKTKEKFSEASEKVKTGLSSASEAAKRKASELSGKAKEKASAAASEAKEKSAELSEKAKECLSSSKAPDTAQSPPKTQPQPPAK